MRDELLHGKRKLLQLALGPVPFAGVKIDVAAGERLDNIHLVLELVLVHDDQSSPVGCLRCLCHLAPRNACHEGAADRLSRFESALAISSTSRSTESRSAVVMQRPDPLPRLPLQCMYVTVDRDREH